MTQEMTVLDLDNEREVRAAQREGSDEGLPIKWRGEVIATLPAELEFAVLAPLKLIDGDLTLLLRQAMKIARDNNQDNTDRWDAAEVVIEVLAANPVLPTTMIDVVKQMAIALLGDDGLELFLQGRPSTQDMAALAKGVFRFYSVSLGEASPSSDSSTDDGGTSNTTSSDTSESTPEDSSPIPAQIAS